MVQKSSLKTQITNVLNGTQEDEIAEQDEVMRMEVTQEEFNGTFGPDSDDEESEDFLDFHDEEH